MYVHSLSHFTLFGGIQAIFGQKRDEIKPEIAPIFVGKLSFLIVIVQNFY